MFSRIQQLKTTGYSPTHVFDIGAHHGHWTISCSQIFQDCQYLMFEAIDYAELNAFRNYSNVRVFNDLLNDKKENVVWNEMRNTGDSIFKENTFHFDNCKQIVRETTTLNDCLKTAAITISSSDRIFIKIDCQGAEIPILKGAQDIISRTDFIIMEMPFFGQYNAGVPSFLEHIQYMDSIGFIPYDFLESHYINNFDMQVDIMFINKNHPLNQVVQDELKRGTLESNV